MIMFLSLLFIESFRIFGSEADGRHLRINLRPGLNVLAGENDSGKTAIVDALRHVLWTTSLEYHRLTEDDFHICGKVRAVSLRITCVFSGLSAVETARYLEWLSVDDEGKPVLYVTLQAIRLVDAQKRVPEGRCVAVTVRSGKNADGPAIEGEIREFLRVTYLRPLRDAEAELAAGKGSRLSRILESHPDFRDENTSDFDPAEPDMEPETLVGIMHHAEHRISRNPLIIAAKGQLNTQYLEHLSVGGDVLQGNIGVARSTELRQVLEKLELWLEPPGEVGVRVSRGLGFNNVLFMASELLLLGEGRTGALPLLLIEEPETHLHPQMQIRLMDFLDEKCTTKECPIQVLLTTHSPNLASKINLEAMTLVHRGKAFSLASHDTKLDRSDYRFLRRFLDVTKANLFFAKGVVIVEGDGENILLPVLADLLDRSFSKNGVSVINVGSRGLFRFSRIFQRQDEQEMPVRVACLADRDIPPLAAGWYVPKRKNRNGEELATYASDFTNAKLEEIVASLKARDSGSVKTFVSPVWTLEHDLSLGELAHYVHIAIQLARRLKNRPDGMTAAEIRQRIREARSEMAGWREEGLGPEMLAAKIYEDLYQKRASKAEAAQVLAELLRRKPPSPEQLRQMLPDYIVEAIDYVTGHDTPRTTADAAGA
jgi:putative ATP-dependent endonuclease of OLD family